MNVTSLELKMDSSCVITINVNGFKYEISREKVLKFLGNTGRFIIGEDELSVEKEIKVNRSRHIFEAILEYCYTGHLHIPQNVCIGAFLEELEFWGIDPKCLERCCFHKYATFVREQENLKGFLRSLRTGIGEAKGNHANKGMKEKVWSIMDGHEETVKSKMFGFISTFFVVLTILNVAFSTIPPSQMDRKAINNSDPKVIIHDHVIAYPEDFMESLSHQSIFNNNESLENNTSLINTTIEDAGFFIFSDDARQKVLTTSNVQGSTSFYLYIEHTANVFFTLELVVRLICCPSIPRYFRDFINIIDFVLLVSSYGRYIVMIADMYGSSINADFILYLQMFRVFRVFRILKHVTAFRILCYSMKLGFRDLLIMFLFLAIGIMIFSNFLYYVESSRDVPSIPEAWWFSIVTMTTVGFGDITPKTVIGKIIGGFCALTGVMMFSLVIPIFVTTFQQLYQYTAVQERRKIKDHQERFGPISMKEMETRCRENN